MLLSTKINKYNFAHSFVVKHTFALDFFMSMPMHIIIEFTKPKCSGQGTQCCAAFRNFGCQKIVFSARTIIENFIKHNNNHVAN